MYIIDSEEGSQTPVQGVAQEPQGRGGADPAEGSSLRPMDPKEDSTPTCHNPVPKEPQEAAHTSVSGNIFILQVFL